MIRIALVTLLLIATARADAPPSGVSDRVRELYASGDYEGARLELLAAYDRQGEPQLLFALGQVELQLGNYEDAIAYYERFIATSPPEDQIALAQQAIGAARIRMKQPPPRPEALPHYPPRHWKIEDTALVALGVAAAVVGGGMLFYSHQLGNDQSGTLADYDHRLDQARTNRWIGIGLLAGGAVVAGVAVVRWRLRPDGGEITASITPTSVGVIARW